VTHFEGGDGGLEALRADAPEAVVATLPRAIQLADVRLSDPSRVPALSFAIVVLTDISGPALKEHHRDLLWRAFHVPVFEHLRDWDGEVIARECEAHDGLHVESPDLPLGRETISILPCPCGRKTPRIGVASGADLERRVAAYAR